jgi:hypothetical protein
VGWDSIKSALHTLLGLWCIAWFGIAGGFLAIGGMECGREIHENGLVNHFSFVLLTLTLLAWVGFWCFYGGEWATRFWRILRLPFVVNGTFLAAFTLLAIDYFVEIAPRLQ